MAVGKPDCAEQLSPTRLAPRCATVGLEWTIVPYSCLQFYVVYNNLRFAIGSK